MQGEDGARRQNESESDDNWVDTQIIDKYVLLVETNEMEQKMKQHYLDENLCPIKYKEDDGQFKKYHSLQGQRTAKELIIGRLNPANKNYICVSNDMVSRTHCRMYIIENDLWPLSKEFVRLLYCREKSDDWRPFARIPNNALKLIFQFMRSVHGYYLADENSRNGTFVEIKDWRRIKKDAIYTLAGERYQLKIIEILNNDSEWDKDYANKVTDFLKRIEVVKATFIPRMPVDNRSTNDTIRHKLSYLFLRIRLDATIFTYVITSQQKLTKMGLGADIDLSDPAVPYSDLQSQIRYHHGKWFIKDGGLAPSTYGTWHKLQNTEAVKLDQHQRIKLGTAISIDFSYRR